MKLPKNKDGIEYGTGIRPEGARLGWVIRYRLKSGELRTGWFSDYDIKLLDESPDKFYKQKRGILRVTSKDRLKAWRYSAGEANFKWSI